MLKAVRISVALLLVLFGSAFVVLDLYADASVQKLAVTAAQQSIYKSQWNSYNAKNVGPAPGYLHLGDLLYANIYAQEPDNFDSYWAAGDYTSEAYQTGWRTTIAKNPNLAIPALEKYGRKFIESFEAELLKKREEQINRNESDLRREKMGEFSRMEFWKEQRIHFNQYKVLIDKLLALNDAKLNELVAGSPEQLWSGSELNDLQKWCLEAGVIAKNPLEWEYGDDWRYGAWSMDTYPVDLIFLTHRVSRDYPEWTPRKFLTQVKTFSSKVEKVLP